MIRLVKAEFLKLRTTQVWFWLLLATVAVAALFVIGPLASGDVSRADQVPDLFRSAGVTAIATFTLGVLGVTTEFRYQTMTATLLITPSRWAVVSAKLIAYAVVGAAYAVLALAVQLAILIPWLATEDVSPAYGSGRVLHALVGALIVVTLFAVVGLGVGALLRNQIVAVVVGLLFLLILENLVLAIPGVRHAWPFTPNGASTAILHTGGSRDTDDGVHLLSSWAGVLVLLLWAFVPAALGATLTMKRDIT